MGWKPATLSQAKAHPAAQAMTTIECPKYWRDLANANSLKALKDLVLE